MALLGFRNDLVQIRRLCDAQGYTRASADRWGRKEKGRSINTAKSLRYLRREGLWNRASPSPSLVGPSSCAGKDEEGGQLCWHP